MTDTATNLTQFEQPASIQHYQRAPEAVAQTPVDRPRPVNKMTLDDMLTLGGSFVASIALTWLLYDNLLPFSGRIGWVAFWFATFVALDCAVTAVQHSGPQVRNRFWTLLVHGAAGLIVLAVGSTVVVVVKHGWDAFAHVNFFTHDMSGIRPTAALSQGGILHALVGSAIELGLATAVSVPLGVGTGVFMVEIGGKFSRVVRTVVEAMTALPDILAGLFIYAVLILSFGYQRSGFCAGMALAVMMLPIIARTTDVALRVVPGGLREASLALGASRWATVWRVVLPTARSGLGTAVILGMARAVGETAPVLITSGASTFFNGNPFDGKEMNSLPLYIISGARSGEPLNIARAYGAAMVLVLFILILFVLARLISRTKTPGR